MPTKALIVQFYMGKLLPNNFLAVRQRSQA